MDAALTLSNGTPGALIVSAVRFVGECLAEVLERDHGFLVRGACETLAHALETAQAVYPEIILLDAAFPGGVETVRCLRASLPKSRIVAIGLAETEEDILAWAEAGIAGYIPNTAPLRELSALLRQISGGEQSCPARISGMLLRRIGNGESAEPPPMVAAGPLTSREAEILRLVGAGLSNKDIARRLGISLGTTKSHVHSLLGKLSLRRRSEVAAQLHGISNGSGTAGARS